MTKKKLLEAAQLKMNSKALIDKLEREKNLSGDEFLFLLKNREDEYIFQIPLA